MIWIFALSIPVALVVAAVHDLAARRRGATVRDSGEIIHDLRRNRLTRKRDMPARGFLWGGGFWRSKP